MVLIILLGIKNLFLKHEPWAHLGEIKPDYVKQLAS